MTMARSEMGAMHDQRGRCSAEDSISPVIKELLEDRLSDVSNEEYLLPR